MFWAALNGYISGVQTHFAWSHHIYAPDYGYHPIKAYHLHWIGLLSTKFKLTSNNFCSLWFFSGTMGRSLGYVMDFDNLELFDWLNLWFSIHIQVTRWKNLALRSVIVSAHRRYDVVKQHMLYSKVGDEELDWTESSKVDSWSTQCMPSGKIVPKCD